MPYYCTVPQCTSMAGKAKNVSFHQFPRDQELARLWNHILKRGKPYTKYSKVCSLHFRPEDYTITSVGKNKGQWRTLRKDAVPSRNLPSEGPPTHQRRNSGAWLPPVPVSTPLDTRMHQQVAQAIYMQTMLAMQQASANGSPQHLPIPPTHVTISEIEQILQNRTANDTSIFETSKESTSYKCMECSKCFKDPDVFVLHKRSHMSKKETEQSPIENGKENCKTTGNGVSSLSRQETLRANPILANLLRSGIPVSNGTENVFDVNNMLSIENQIMATITANMESYIRNLSTILSEAKSNSEGLDQNGEDSEQDGQNSENDAQNSEHDDQNSEHDQNENDERKILDCRLRVTEDTRLNQQIIDLKLIKAEPQDMAFEQNVLNSDMSQFENEHDDQNCKQNGQKLVLNHLKSETNCSLEENKDNCENSARNSFERDTEMTSQFTEKLNEVTSERHTNLVTLSDLDTELQNRTKCYNHTELGFKTEFDEDFHVSRNSKRNYTLHKSQKSFDDQKLTQNDQQISQFDHDMETSNHENTEKTYNKKQNNLRINENDQEVNQSQQNGQYLDSTDQNFTKKYDFDRNEGSSEPICDSEDLIESKDSNNLVIDSNV